MVVTLSSVTEVAFQVALLPSVPQEGQTLPLVTSQVAKGNDLFTGSALQDTVQSIDMRIVTDPGFQESWSKVSP